jgi:hypothetical protein
MEITLMITGLICIIDVLGTKGIWSREKPEVIVENWKNINKALCKNVETFSKILDNKEEGYQFHFYTFSDSIIITVNVAEMNSLINLCGIVGDLFSYALEKKILFRGSISMGQFHSDEEGKIIIGPAIDDAAEWYNQSDWAGVNLTPKTSFWVDELIELNKSMDLSIIQKIIKKYAVPMKKTNPISLWVVSWPSIYLNFDIKGKTLNKDKLRLKLLSMFSNTNIGLAEQSKFYNTLSFFETCEK